MTTLAELKVQVLDVADMTGSSFPVDARVGDYLNKELARLHRRLVSAYADHICLRTTISISSSAQSYSLPDDFLKLRKLFLLNSAGERIKKIERCHMDELAVGETGLTTVTNNKYLMHFIAHNKLWFHRLPSGSDTVELWYVPQFNPLEDDADEIHYSVPVDWEDFVVEGAAARLLERAQLDSSAQRARVMEIDREIQSAAKAGRSSEPLQVRDAYRRWRRNDWEV